MANSYKDFYVRENNSGGFCVLAASYETEWHIRARSEQEAIKKFEKKYGRDWEQDQQDSCPCCGVRWSIYTEPLFTEDIRK